MTDFYDLCDALLETVQPNILIEKAQSEFETLKKNKKPLTDDERKECMDCKAVWHHGPNGEPSPAVWKSVNPDSGKTTFVTNTHRAYNTASTMKGAINKYHNFIKGTA